ncbi:MAG TPA: EAL domain-containing protein [Steroidobacteraceae bacterium]|nr:EAL domain-containing protein [Steroidobacteraceae bacterium]
MFRRLRTRIIFFFVALLAVVQVVAFLAVNAANSTNAREKIDGELEVGQRIFARLLEQNRDRLSQAARVMAADYALRSAIATDDVQTVISALRNHGNRINADMTMLVSMDRTVVADTFAREANPHQFEFPLLIERAVQYGSASSIELLNGHAYQLVVVPVLAPEPIAWIVVGFVIDNALAGELRQLTALEVSFLESTDAGRWRVLASTLNAHDASFTAALPDLPSAKEIHSIGVGEQEQQIRVIPLDHFGDRALVAVLQRSVAEAIAAFDRLRTTLIALGIMSLIASIIGSALIALSVTRPISHLSEAAERIQEGRYEEPVTIVRSDEIGALATSINHMREGIAAREQEILRLAYRDTLTQLPNRSLFNDRLRAAIAAASAASRSLAVLVMDLDRFKEINDALGHTVGDHVLREFARLLSEAVRDPESIARLGGDEFAVLLENVDQQMAEHLTQQIARAFEPPIDYQGQLLDVGASIGLALYPQHGADSGTLLRNADIAMYVAKRNKSGVALFDPQYDKHQQQHLSMLGELRRAVERGELRVFYQPKVTLAISGTRSAEALLRWEHPTRGFIPPGEFIPFAEQTGYIKVLTRWVLEESIRQCGRWRANGQPVRVSVNISARDLSNRDLPDVIAQLLLQNATPAELLCLEITESGFMEDPTHARAVMQRLHDLGVKLSIDDYGTGYSSLAYIAQLPVHELKIDRSFISRMTEDAMTTTIVRSTIELGHSLGLNVVAEGVEDEAGVKVLKQYGCDHLQGYFFSPPLPPAKFEEWLRASKWGYPTADVGSTSRITRLKLPTRPI